MLTTHYGEFRNQVMRETAPTVFSTVVLRDADSNYVPIPISERLVQAIWFDQRLRADELRTTDDRPVRILFPGWWNLEAGPDFRNATVQIGDDPELTGDIEIHLRADDWFHHGHDNDPGYNHVVLHIVLWESGSDVRPRTLAGDLTAQLVLQHHLAAPLETLYDEIDLDAYPHNAGNHEGPCAALLTALPTKAVGTLLDAAGDERFAIKIRKFTRWMHRAGIPQAFHEGWIEALGYKANKTAFRTLAQRLPLRELSDHRADLAPLFFGVANFLPTDRPKTRNAAGQQYVKRLWNRWWKLRPEFGSRSLNADLWRLHGIRPANHPHRRLGAAVALLKRHPNLLEKVIGSIESDGAPAKLFLQARDEYWARHFTLGGQTQSHPTDLIGSARAEAIVTNVVLPFVAAYARDDANPRLEQQAAARYAAAPAEATNSMLRLAAQQLFGSAAAAKPFLTGARRQQGITQIFQDFCIHDKSICRNCQFTDLAQRWAETVK